MKSVIIIIIACLLVAAAVAEAAVPGLAGYSVRRNMKPLLASAPLAIGGATDCGSLGTVSDLRLTSCILAPCQLVIGSTYHFEVDFTPSASFGQLHLFIEALHDDHGHTIIDQNIPDSAVVGGQSYTVRLDIPITTVYAGSDTIVVKLNGVGVTTNQVCQNIPVRVIN